MQKQDNSSNDLNRNQIGQNGQNKLSPANVVPVNNKKNAILKRYLIIAASLFLAGCFLVFSPYLFNSPKGRRAPQSEYQEIGLPSKQKDTEAVLEKMGSEDGENDEKVQPLKEYTISVCSADEAYDEDSIRSFGFFFDDRDSISISRYTVYYTDETTGVSKMFATIDLPSYDTSWQPSDEDCHVVGRNGNVWLFYICHDFMTRSTFLIDVPAEKLLYLEGGPIVYKNDINSQIILGQWPTYDIGGTSPLYLYDWEGKLLLQIDSVYGTTLYNGTVYYAVLNNGVYEIHSIEIPSLQDGKLCEVVLPEDGFLSIDSHGVHWEYSDINYDYHSDSMGYDELHNVKIEVIDKTTLYAKLAQQVEQHYTNLFHPAGDYVCFDYDYEEDSERFFFVLRYQMSEEEAAEREANGAIVEPNSYVATVWIEKKTGEASDEWSWDNWYADMG